ncbi:MAG: peptide chain release factor N(5)-glutamine methyltransferase [Caldilineaceae bacterium]
MGRALVSATERLRDVGIDTPQLDAQVILAYVLKRERSWLFAHHDHKLCAEEAEEYTELIVRRSHHEPVAYLTRRKEFYGLEFYVDSRVLIPRPETELLVDAVLNQVEMYSEELAVGEHVHVLDVGTGCGAIAAAVAANCPEVKVYATDVSPDAIAVARENIKRLDARLQITLLEGDLLSPLANKVDMNRVDIMAANLPYINTTDYGALEPDVRNFEPKLALEAGPDGLDTIRRLLVQAPDFLKPGGVIFLEIGSDQGPAVVGLAHELMPNAALVDLRQDYNGRDRLVTIVP